VKVWYREGRGVAGSVLLSNVREMVNVKGENDTTCWEVRIGIDQLDGFLKIRELLLVRG
jgi:hypothetical protein